MQPPPGIPDALGQPRLDVHVDVLERLGKRKFSGLDLRGNRAQPALYRAFVLLRQNPKLRQHGGMRERTPDVLPPHLAVEADRGIYLLHHHRRAGRESATPLRIGVAIPEVRITKAWSFAHTRRSIMHATTRRAALTGAGALAAA